MKVLTPMSAALLNAGLLTAATVAEAQTLKKISEQQSDGFIP